MEMAGNRRAVIGSEVSDLIGGRYLTFVDGEDGVRAEELMKPPPWPDDD